MSDPRLPLWGTTPDPIKPDTVREWYFTFGIGRYGFDAYTVITGTYESSREKMFARFGRNWAFQYPSLSKLAGRPIPIDFDSGEPDWTWVQKWEEWHRVARGAVRAILNGPA